MRHIHPTNRLHNLFLQDAMKCLSVSLVIIMHRIVDIGAVLVVILIIPVEFTNFLCLLFRIIIVYIPH